MARVFGNCTVKVNTVDLSAEADKATVEQSLDAVDVTVFGATNKMVTPGLGDAKVTVEFFQNFAAAKVDATLRAMFTASRNGTPGTIEIVPEAALAVSATNPRITMVCFLMNYTGLDAAVGDASKMTAEFVNAGTAGITFGTV